MRIGIACESGPPPAEVLDLLETAGLPAAAPRDAVSPAHLPAGDFVWLLGSGTDVLRACDRGGLDLGVVGKDRLLEARRGVGELLDLRCCRDELVVAAVGAGERPDRRRRIATRYPAAARRHFAAAGRRPELLTFDEPALAVMLGLADGVVDLASRLAATPDVDALLGERELVAACSARLVAGRAARALLGAPLGELVDRLRTTLEAR
jgi:ATP phosphoribosyltransferase